MSQFLLRATSTSIARASRVGVAFILAAAIGACTGNPGTDGGDVGPRLDTADATDVAADVTDVRDTPHVPTCPAGQAFCGVSCVDILAAVDNCGACEHVCPAAPGGGVTTCVNGVCHADCRAGSHLCGADCVPDDSITSCGSACTPCPVPANAAAATCTAGVCGLTCVAAHHACGSNCVSNLSTDSCGTSCSPCPTPANAVATCSGVCGFACNPSFVIVGGDHCDVPVVRPIGPLSMGTVTTQRPTLRWSVPSGVDRVTVEICADRACGTVVQTFDATSTSGQPATPLSPGVAFWRLRGHIGAVTGVQTSPVWEFFVGARSAPGDTSWGTTLDINGDGFADLATSTSGGGVFVFVGSASGLVTSTLRSAGALDLRMLAAAGDVDGDGFGDLMTTTALGNVVLLNGPDLRYGSEVTPPPTTLSFTQSQIAGLGDVDGDGYGDIVVGAHGSATVYYGNATGVASTRSTLVTGVAGDNFGGTVAAAGDVNGDGFADLAVGASWTNSQRGQVFVYLGGASGVSTTPVATLGALVLANALFGDRIVATDLNGDGRSDVIVSAPGAFTNAGLVVAFMGSATGVNTTAPVYYSSPDGAGSHFGAELAVGDSNGDGYADLVAGSSLSRAFLYRGGATPGTSTSATMVDAAAVSFGRWVGLGDSNGDHRSDFCAVENRTSGTGVAIYLGDATLGLPVAPSATLTAFTYSIAQRAIGGRAPRV